MITCGGAADNVMATAGVRGATHVDLHVRKRQTRWNSHHITQQVSIKVFHRFDRLTPLNQWQFELLCMLVCEATRPESATGGSTGSFLRRPRENKAETTSLLCSHRSEAQSNSLTLREEKEVCRASVCGP